jgi:ParB family transcriptional regulator, chromosome partitioning protein
MSLVEDLARRHPGSLELMREIGALKKRGYNNAEIAAKTDFTPDYIAAICYLLEHGEERLLIAVERGVMPANIAMGIARSPDGDVQRALAEAYEPPSWVDARHQLSLFAFDGSRGFGPSNSMLGSGGTTPQDYPE